MTCSCKCGIAGSCGGVCGCGASVRGFLPFLCRRAFSLPKSSASVSAFGRFAFFCLRAFSSVSRWARSTRPAFASCSCAFRARARSSETSCFTSTIASRNCFFRSACCSAIVFNFCCAFESFPAYFSFCSFLNVSKRLSMLSSSFSIVSASSEYFAFPSFIPFSETFTIFFTNAANNFRLCLFDLDKASANIDCLSFAILCKYFKNFFGSTACGFSVGFGISGTLIFGGCSSKS